MSQKILAAVLSILMMAAFMPAVAFGGEGNGQDLEAQKQATEDAIATLIEERDAAQAQVEALPAEIEAARQAKAAAETKWAKDKLDADAAIVTAQANMDNAGRRFIDQKITENKGFDIDTMIARCRTYTSAAISPAVSDTSGKTYSTLADIANSQNFETIVNRGCTYENLKKSIAYIREANAHRNLPIHNAGDLKVSYQLMGTALISGAVCFYKTGHNFIMANESIDETDFWYSGNSDDYGENLSYSQASSEIGWDPFHGWYYRERMRAIANERNVPLTQNIVNEILNESAANGFTYNPYGSPWNRTEQQFMESIKEEIGHYKSIINMNYTATGFAYIDGPGYNVAKYPYVSAQEFNADTSASVTIDQYEQELEAWFQSCKDALNATKAARQNLEAKPAAITDAENAVREKEAALAGAQQTVQTKNDAISQKQLELAKIEAAMGRNPSDPGQTQQPRPKPQTQQQSQPSPGPSVAPSNLGPSTPDHLKPDAAAVGQTIMNQKSDGEPKGSTFSLIQLKSSRQAAKANTLTWKRVSGATAYVVYGSKSGKANRFQKLAVTGGTSFKHTGLKKGTYYKYIVVAVKGDRATAISKVVHVATKGNKKAVNPKSLSVTAPKKSKATIKRGKTVKIKAKQNGKNIKKHRGLCYESANPAIATVSSKGVVKGVKAGKTKVYVYAQNGVAKAVTIMVK